MIGFRRRRRTGGFTLIEMLIVVAVIAVLAAVSIPMVNTSLEKARVATDQANERSAKAVALLDYLTEHRTGNATYYYRADGTALLPLTDEEVPSPGSPGYDYGQSQANRGSCVRVDITVDGSGALAVQTVWEVIRRD